MKNKDFACEIIYFKKLKSDYRRKI